MNLADVHNLLQRIERARGFARDTSGGDVTWDYTFPDGQTHNYTVRGVKNPEAIGHDVATWSVWLWSMKDRLKAMAAAAGRNPQVVEDAVNGDRSLQICADLANLEKHGALRQSRSGLFPRYGKVSYALPQQGLAALTVGAFSVTVDVSDPALVEVTLPVLDHAGNKLGDAFDLLDASLLRWEGLLRGFGVAV